VPRRPTTLSSADSDAQAAAEWDLAKLVHDLDTQNNARMRERIGRLGITTAQAAALPMRGLKRLASARTIAAEHAFVHNLRRGYYKLTSELPVHDRVRVAFDKLAPGALSSKRLGRHVGGRRANLGLNATQPLGLLHKHRQHDFLRHHRPLIGWSRTAGSAHP
jgi:hypothetical protein